jgi:hypothetical protein
MVYLIRYWVVGNITNTMQIFHYSTHLCKNQLENMKSRKNHIQIRIGITTNNKVGPIATNTLLDLAWENGFQYLNLYGDSKIIVVWFNGSLYTLSIHQ